MAEVINNVLPISRSSLSRVLENIKCRKKADKH